MTITAGAAAFRQAIADRYAIVRELGEGGMATAFLARDLKHGRDVAIKVLKPEVGQTLGAERFLREIQVAARLSHPHILPEHRAMLTEIALPGVAAVSPGQTKEHAQKMFERYTDDARRSLFFARDEVTQLGGVTIEPEHLMLGVLRAAPQAILRFSRGTASALSLRTALERAAATGEKISTSIEIPFSPSCKSALEQTPNEADAAKNVWIGPVHIVLGVLVRTDGAAARILLETGLTAAAIREHLATTPEEPRSAVPEVSRPAPGMISRQWKGVVKPGKGDEYLTHLRRETLPALARLDGFVTASILRREVEDGTEFEIVTIWRAVAAIELFAGADVTRAVVPPAAQALMVRYDEHAVHYEIVQQMAAGSVRTAVRAVTKEQI